MWVDVHRNDRGSIIAALVSVEDVRRRLLKLISMSDLRATVFYAKNKALNFKICLNYCYQQTVRVPRKLRLRKKFRYTGYKRLFSDQ